MYKYAVFTPYTEHGAYHFRGYAAIPTSASHVDADADPVALREAGIYQVDEVYGEPV